MVDLSDKVNRSKRKKYMLELVTHAVSCKRTWVRMAQLPINCFGLLSHHMPCYDLSTIGGENRMFHLQI